jgi:hypothetical protein
MGDLVPDEVVEEFAVVADGSDVQSRVTERFAGLIDRFTLPGDLALR